MTLITYRKIFLAMVVFVTAGTNLTQVAQAADDTPQTDIKNFKKYPNISRDVSWIPAESSFQKDFDFIKVP